MVVDSGSCVRPTAAFKRRQRRLALSRGVAARDILALVRPPPLSRECLLRRRFVLRVAPVAVLEAAGAGRECFHGAADAGRDGGSCRVHVAPVAVFAPFVGEATDIRGVPAAAPDQIMSSDAPSRCVADEGVAVRSGRAAPRNMPMCEFLRVSAEVKERLPHRPSASPVLMLCDEPMRTIHFACSTRCHMPSSVSCTSWAHGTSPLLATSFTR